MEVVKWHEIGQERFFGIHLCRVEESENQWVDLYVLFDMSYIVVKNVKTDSGILEYADRYESIYHLINKIVPNEFSIKMYEKAGIDYKKYRKNILEYGLFTYNESDYKTIIISLFGRALLSGIILYTYGTSWLNIVLAAVIMGIW